MQPAVYQVDAALPKVLAIPSLRLRLPCATDMVHDAHALPWYMLLLELPHTLQEYSCRLRLSSVSSAIPRICWHSCFTLCAQQQRTRTHTASSQNPIAPAVTAHTHAGIQIRPKRTFIYNHTARASTHKYRYTHAHTHVIGRCTFRPTQAGCARG